MNTDRRHFLRTATGGLAAYALSALVPRSLRAELGWERRAGEAVFDLNITEALVEMVDLTVVYMLAYENPAGLPSIPGPLISVSEGTSIIINVRNTLTNPHAFSIPGVVDSGPIAPGQTAQLRFAAPAPGTYLYFDGLNGPVNRVLGLHGVLIVVPSSGNSPYRNPPQSVAQLFNDLGRSALFPGSSWTPDRSFIWVFNSIDPRFNAAAQSGATIDPAQFTETFLARYFTLTGKTGFFAATDPSIAPSGRIGQPALIRTLNAGMPTHSPHIHGNHVYVLTSGAVVQDNVFLVDTWSMPPLERKDVLLPFIQPPDIPTAVFPPREEKFPLHYPMHCHTEMSQTAGGGNYPQGLITHWAIEGPLAV